MTLSANLEKGKFYSTPAFWHFKSISSISQNYHFSAQFRSYGSVFKALHKETGQVLAIKQVPVDTDLQEIIKEISIMQQCDSTYVVKYYGSYFKNTDLWVSIISEENCFISVKILVKICNFVFFRCCRLLWNIAVQDLYLI